MNNEFYIPGSQRVFSGESLSEVAFPLGGIGTGTISLGGRGDLRDFEIFGHPDKGRMVPFTFFALWAKEQGKPTVTKILEGKHQPPYRGWGGFGGPMAGAARFSDVSFVGEYPRAVVKLSDPEVPVAAELTAWNPFIPLNVQDSALPVAVFEWKFTNTTSEPVEISLASTISSPLNVKEGQNGSVNEFREANGIHGIVITNPEGDPEDVENGTLALATTWKDFDVQAHLYRGGWWDKHHIFWDDFSEDGRLEPVLEAEPGKWDASALALRATVPANGSVMIPVFITWHFPVIANPWLSGAEEPRILKTYSGANFEDAWDVAEYVTKNLDRLRAETDLWHETMFSSSLPAHVIDAVTSQASIIRTPTCFLLEDGSFFGWEGCSDHQGCCHGNCTHVWNYEQSLAFLFPELEQSMRRTEFLHNTRENGNMAFRSSIPPGAVLCEFAPCADGQMGTIMQVYRDWQLSGDDALLRELWPNVKRALEFAWSVKPGEGSSVDTPWDPDKDGVMEGVQHNTYDIEFYGPNTMCTAMYLGALRACEEMARYLGETEKAEEYRVIYESGRAKVDSELWNGDYYIQKVEVIDGLTVPEHLRSPKKECCGPTCTCKQTAGGKVPAMGEEDVVPKYQYGEGCLSDQLLGQTNAHIFGLGYLLEPEHVKTAVKSIFDSNFRESMASFTNVQRVYALNDEAGLLLCSWPKGNRPALPFVYSDEVWTGIEYHVAAHLIYEGYVDEGLTIVKAVRDRYAGYNRNPWDEIECGHHYARAMASWGVKLALDGFTYSLPEGRLGFAPKLNKENFSTFWSTGTGWGRFSQDLAKGEFTFEVLCGEQILKRLDLGDLASDKVVVIGPEGEISAWVEGKSVVFESPITVNVGERIVVACR